MSNQTFNYPKNSVMARHFAFWSKARPSDRDAFISRCEAAPAGSMHGAIAAEWEAACAVRDSQATS